jgi:hypothetical protein
VRVCTPISVKVRAGGLDDKEAVRAASLVGGYFDMERARAARRLVWRVVAVSGLAMWAIGVATSALTRVDVAFGVVLLGGAASASVIHDWRARKKLAALVEARS